MRLYAVPVSNDQDNDQRKDDHVDPEMQPDDRKDEPEDTLGGLSMADVILEHFHNVLHDMVPLQPHNGAQGQRQGVASSSTAPEEDQNEGCPEGSVEHKVDRSSESSPEEREEDADEDLTPWACGQ